jgi:hypothetical protein
LLPPSQALNLLMCHRPVPPERNGRVVDRFGNVRTDPVVYSASPAGVSVSSAGMVTTSATGRYTVTATAGSASASSAVSVIPQGTLAVVRGNFPSFRIISVGLDGSDLRDLTAVADGGIGPRPKWIPGSSTIIYSHYDGSLQLLRTVDAEGRVTGLTSTSVCSEPGSSGAPLYSGTQAQGVISGGSGNCQTGGTTFFQPINRILSTYGLTLVRG